MNISKLILFAFLIQIIVSVVHADEELTTTEEIPTLPEIPGVGEGNDDGVPTISLKLGEKKKLDHIGPLIINSDGTTKRVTNWDEMTKEERDAAYDRIISRNKHRLSALKDRIAKDAIKEAEKEL